MALGISLRSFIPFKQGQGEKGGLALPISKIPGMGIPSASASVLTKIPLPVAAPPQGSPDASTPIQNVIPAPFAPQGFAAPLTGEAAPPLPTGEAAPPAEKKAGKDVMNLFLEEDVKITQAGNLAATLPDYDMASIYKECLSCKQMLG